MTRKDGNKSGEDVMEDIRESLGSPVIFNILQAHRDMDGLKLTRRIININKGARVGRDF